VESLKPEQRLMVLKKVDLENQEAVFMHDTVWEVSFITKEMADKEDPLRCPDKGPL